MRRLIVIIGVMVGLALPVGAGAGAGAGAPKPPADGTLVVDSAQGVAVLAVRGGIIGRFDSGSITIDDPLPNDGPAPVVKGYQSARQVAPNQIKYSGEGDVRFRLTGGPYRVRIAAQGIDVTVVGRGTAMLNGAGFSDLQTGRYSLNGGQWQPMPSAPKWVTLGMPLVPGK